MQVRIYRPAKTAMQQGRAGTKDWVVEFEPAQARQIDPLMGWTSSADTKGQLELRFETREEAVAYAQKRGLMYLLEEPEERQPRPKAYADNFRFTRIGRWTH